MSGAAMLLLLGLWTPAPAGHPVGSWMSTVVLSLYAVPFSFAYIDLSTGTGALIILGCVQVTTWIGPKLGIRLWDVFTAYSSGGGAYRGAIYERSELNVQEEARAQPQRR
jgi:hypothetical protein